MISGNAMKIIQLLYYYGFFLVILKEYGIVALT
jgi:hypothetical protein